MHIRFLHSIFHSCEQATLLAVKKEEGRLTPAEKAGLFFHLLICSFCRRFVKQSRRLQKMGQSCHEQMHDHPAPFTLSPESQARMQEEIEKHL